MRTKKRLNKKKKRTQQKNNQVPNYNNYNNENNNSINSINNISNANNTNNNNTINNKKKKKRKGKFSKKHPKLAIAIKLTIILLLASIVVGAGIIVGMLYGMWGQDFEISEEELLIRGNSVIYNSEGKVIAELSGDENRKIIKLEDMSEYLPKAYIAIEDERFYSHSGVDFKRTTAAIGNYILHRGSSSYGGSTITQQLVKNMTDAKERTGMEGITRKIKEWAKAYQIERMLTKNQILELYLNVIFVGEVNYGVEVGSLYYFNKSAKDLDLAECAFLAGINNAPNAYNPYGDYPYKKNEKKTNLINNRTKTVLGKMLELGYISQEEYDKACQKVEKGFEFKKGSKKTMIYSYHTDAVISKVIDDFVKEKGWTKEYATTYLYGGGLKIYSTERPEVQEKIEEIMSEDASEYTKKVGKVKSQAATVIIDNDTGYVVGLYGGLGEKTTSRGLNRATQSTRSTGSSIKPIAELVPGIQEGIINPSTMYLDVKTEFDVPGSKKKYVPTNEGAYTGEAMSVRKATGKSQNVPFVKMMAEITNSVSRDYLKKMGITSVDEDTGLSLALGGLNKGITPLEMAGAYATIANDGVYRTPLLYTKVENSDGKTELEPKQETRDVCSKQTAYLVKDLLTSVVEAGYGTAPYCAISGIDVAAKTGTTNNQKDRWLCGFTNYYTGATWFGFDEGQEVPEGGTNPAGRIWSAVMKLLHEDKSKSRFEEPSGIVKVKVCSNTGLRATSKCGSTYYEIFREGAEPEYCDEKGNYADICEDTGNLATEYCPNVITKYFSDGLPKEKLGLWNSLGVSYKKAPVGVCKMHTAETNKQNADAPKIQILGQTTMTLNIGDSYVEKGATATDSKDGNLTGNIQTSGSVNTSKAGTYTITYTVKNSSDKQATATRTIIVKDKSAPEPVNPKPHTNTTNTTNTTGGDKTNTTDGGKNNTTGGSEKTNTTGGGKTNTTSENTTKPSEKNKTP